MIQQPTNNGAIPWFVENFRLTAFPGPSARVNSSGWWEKVVGQPPDNQSAQPKFGIMREDGLFEGAKLILSVQPSRIDWLFISAYDQESDGPAFEKLSDFISGTNTFLKAMNRWLAISPTLSRLAFGAVLVMPVANKIAGYEKISPFLPNMKLDPHNSSDFLYQINRPRESEKIKELKINRLCKWSVAITTLTQIVLGPNNILPIPIPEAQRLLARLELDINTASEFADEFSQDNVNLLFQELISLGKEIASKGDIP